MKQSGVRRLLAIRWTGQLSDGIFQSALASFVLFSPERQPDAKSAAAAFAVVLLPYSVVGPLVGTILDRISRQRIVLLANLFRALTLLFITGLVRNGATGIELTIFVLIAFGINRLILAGLSAGLPLLIEGSGDRDRTTLVSVNATAVTGGTIFVVIGGGIGIGVRNLVDANFRADYADALLIFIALIGFTVAGLISLTLNKSALGPLAHELRRESVLEAYREMVQGFRFLRAIADCFRGIIATSIHRAGLTALTLMALLLSRNTFNNPANPEAGLATFATAITAAGFGVFLGALIAPTAVTRFGRHNWIRISLFASSIFPFLMTFNTSETLLITSGFFTALAGQGLKVTNDALIQSTIADVYRGRVFAVYDVLVNCGIVGGALVAAMILPKSGISSLLPFIIGATYCIVAALLLRKTNFKSRS